VFVAVTLVYTVSQQLYQHLDHSAFDEIDSILGKLPSKTLSHKRVDAGYLGGRNYKSRCQ
jgi:hypothetical protein